MACGADQRGTFRRLRSPLSLPCIERLSKKALASVWALPKTFAMTHREAIARHAALAEEIRRHDYAYYVLARPSISDQEYDRLYKELLELESAFTDLRTPESPTQRVGGMPLKEFHPVPHLRPMMSLDNTYSQAEVREFVARVQRLLANQNLEWVVEPKVDGVAINLRYEQGKFTLGAT